MAAEAAAHWRGELPLARSVGRWWLLPGLTLMLVCGGLACIAALAGGAPLRLAAAALLALVPPTALVLVFGGVGAWRAAGASARADGSAAAALAVRAGVAVVLAVGGASLAVNMLPRAGSWWQLAAGRDPLGRLEIRWSDDRQRLHLEGPLALGDSVRLRQALDGAAPVRGVVLRSHAGRLGEAIAIAAIVRENGWPVRVDGPCVQGCVLVLMAGSRRQLTAEARLGVQRPALPTFNPLWRLAGQAWVEHQFRRAGWPEQLLARLRATPAWSLESLPTEELRAGDLFRLPQATLDVDLPAAAEGTPADHADELAAHPAWRVLARRFADLPEAAGRRMHEAAKAASAADDGGAADHGADLQLAAQRELAARLPLLLLAAGPELRHRFAMLLADQLHAVRDEGAAACAAVLDGDAAIRRRLPLELRAREAAWLAEAASEPPRAPPARPPRALEMEVIGRNLGPAAARRLAALWRPRGGATAGVDCDAAHSLIMAAATLPAAERRLAWRLLLEKP